MQQALGLAHDPGLRRANQARGAGLDPFGALGRLAHHQHGLPERGGLLLDAARVGEHNVRAAQETDEGRVIDRRQQVHAFETAEDLSDRLLHVGVQVHGVDQLDVAVALDQRPQGAAQLLEGRPEVLAPVRRHQDQAAPLREVRERAPVARGDVARHPLQGVDDGVAGDGDLVCGYVLAEQVVARPVGRGEVPLGERGRHRPVELLRERSVLPPRAQPGLDVADGNPRVERGQRGGERRRSVALDEHCRRAGRGEDVGQALDGDDVNEALLAVQVEEDAPVAEPPPEAGTLSRELLDVASHRVDFHLVEGCPYLLTLFFSSAGEIFERDFSRRDGPHRCGLRQGSWPQSGDQRLWACTSDASSRRRGGLRA